MSESIYDLIIIGGGPAGLTSLIYALRGGINTILIESNPYGCGQISLTERVDNYPGLYGISGFDLGDKFIEHAASLGGTIVSDTASRIEKTSDGDFVVHTASSKEYKAKTVIYALGAKHRKLDIAGEEKYTGKGVSYCATCDAMFFKNKDVAVIGGGDTALGDALTLAKLSKKVYLVHRRDEFRGARINVERVKNTNNIELVLNSIPLEIHGKERVESLLLNSKTLTVDGVFVAIGEVPNSALVKDLADIDKSGYVITDNDCQTKTKGLYAVGDVRAKRLRQVVTAVSDGAVAATSVADLLATN